MWKRHLAFSISFGIIAFLNILSESIQSPELRLVVKPLICIFLFTYLITTTKLTGGFRKLIFAGLIFSFLGDCALLFANRAAIFFLAGLVSFLIAHIFYSVAFYRDFKNDPMASKKFGHVMLFVLGIFSLSYYTYIRPYLGDLKLPVMVYIFIISMMAILAAYRYKRVNLLSFRLIITGAVFFIISDSALAYNKFVSPYPFAGVIIMGTYMIAQYLITIGSIERKVVGMPKKTELY
ncbi:lysoplasmalogenase [Daejeonella oryzae]|uniref:lysoplasmalogenase n=1 Tax=Daejeonella oryzae TaxID=1122943 RepID=UPI00041F4DB5|nr:lysoplasmalogenase [Daejeonella oryzae]